MHKANALVLEKESKGEEKEEHMADRTSYSSMKMGSGVSLKTRKSTSLVPVTGPDSTLNLL